MTLDKGRWTKLELELWRINIALDTWEVSVNDVRSLSGVLCWASKVIEYGMIYVRELYGVVSDLGMSSCSTAMGRVTFFEDANLIRRIRLDIGWWMDLCKDYRTMEGAVHERRISHVGVPRLLLSAYTLEIYSDMSGKALGGYWHGTSLWCYSPNPTWVTLDKNLRNEKGCIVRYAY